MLPCSETGPPQSLKATEKPGDKASSTTHLHHDEVPEDVDVPEVAKAKQGSEEPAQHHSPRQVITQGEALPKNATAKREGRAQHCW